MSVRVFLVTTSAFVPPMHVLTCVCNVFCCRSETNDKHTHTHKRWHINTISVHPAIITHNGKWMESTNQSQVPSVLLHEHKRPVISFSPHTPHEPAHFARHQGIWYVLLQAHTPHRCLRFEMEKQWRYDFFFIVAWAESVHNSCVLHSSPI